MKRYLRLFLLPLASLLMACSSDPVDTTGSISGIVKDDVSDALISGATVSISPTNRNTTTDANGNYQFLNVEQGQYTITVQKNQYQEALASVEVKMGQSTEHNFSLTPSSGALLVEPSELHFGTSVTQQGLDIINQGRGTLEWKISNDASWISFSQDKGKIQPKKRSSVIITIDRSGLTPDDYTATPVITSTDGGHKDIAVFMTVVGLPQLTTTDARCGHPHTATVGARLTVVGDKNGVTEYGHVYSTTSKEPSIENGDRHTNLHNANGILNAPGTFTSQLDALRSATTYYVRAYARNRLGYSYGNSISFRTEEAQQTGLGHNDYGKEEDWDAAK